MTRPVDQDEWDQLYAERRWSGDPNGALVAEAADLAPGRALDVGCGEGADAVWLAQRGWRVTALDPSRVALDRAAEVAAAAGVEVELVHAGLLEAALGAYDLVSAQYPALKRTPDHAAERALLGAVAPGGTLLFVHHLLDDASRHRSSDHGFDPDDYVQPPGLRDLLADGWDVAYDDRRARHVRGGAGAGHSFDVVLRATRRVGAQTTG